MSERGRSVLPAPLARVAAHPRVVPATALALRARAVRQSAAFAARELGRRGGTFAYALRSNDLCVLVRHGSADPVTLGEVFHELDYEPPARMRLSARAPRIVDLGANVGYFGAFALGRWSDATVTAYEPDPENAAVHARTIALNGLGARWTLRPAAAAARSGELRFSATHDALSHLDEQGELVVAAEDVLPLIADADLLKLDVEGGEWPILADPRFAAAPPRAVVLEHHPQGAPGDDPRAAVLELLAAAGLTEVESLFERAEGYGMLWAWRP